MPSSRVWTDRSRIEIAQRCQRLRWLEYHEQGTGITSAKKPLPLAVGGAVHVGLEYLLLGKEEDAAVSAAISDLSQYRGHLALDAGEQVQDTTTSPASSLGNNLADMAKQLGIAVDDPLLADLLAVKSGQDHAKEYDEWLWQEQSGLVEGLVRAYARRRLKPLLAEYEVLEVEREGEWLLASLVGDDPERLDHTLTADIMFMSRPDALLRSRADNSLYLLSFKTAASWDFRKEKDAQHDMQGLSEGVEVERRLGEWWRQIQAKEPFTYNPHHSSSEGEAAEQGRIPTVAIAKYLRDLPAPPRILGIRYEYLLKSYRGEDKDLSARFGFKVWSQRSSLVRAYQGTKSRDLNVSWDFVKDDGGAGKLAWQNWKSRPLADLGISVRQWIDMLDDSTETMSAYDSTTGLEPRALGWSSKAQVSGFLAQHPLDAIFVPPIIVYRSDDDLRDWLEQTESQEVRIAEAVAGVNAAADEDERRSMLNRHFPMTRKACSYPSECPMIPICYGGSEMKANPLASERYARRVANHQAEKEAQHADQAL